MTKLQSLLTELKRLEREAREGTWEPICIQKEIYPGHYALYPGATKPIFIDDPWSWTQKDRPEIKQICKDADFIAALRNASPVLIEALEIAFDALDKIVGTKEYIVNKRPEKYLADMALAKLDALCERGR